VICYSSTGRESKRVISVVDPTADAENKHHIFCKVWPTKTITRLLQ